MNNNENEIFGKLLFYKRHSNIFLILLDNNWKHLATFTGGSCKLGKNKKKKTSPFNLLNLVAALKECLLKRNIKFLDFYLKQKFSRHLFNLKKMFRLNEIKITNYIFLLYKSYGLPRKRKVRRV